VANLGFEAVKFPKPLYHGDTLYTETEIIDKRLSSSRPGQGIVSLRHIGRNQHGDVVAECSRSSLLWESETKHREATA